jgi:hypothetical protein
LFYQLQSPLFGPAEGGIDGAFAQIDSSSFDQISGQRLQDHFETPVPLPLLKPTMAGLIGWIAIRQILPLRPGAQNPEHAIQHFPRVPPRSPSAIGTTWFDKHWLQHLPLSVFQIHAVDRRTIGPSYLAFCALFLAESTTFSSFAIYEMGSNNFSFCAIL